MIKKIILAYAITALSVAAKAQERPPQVPPPKNIVPTKLPKLPRQTNTIAPTQLPATVSGTLKMFKWKLVRWWVTGNIGHSETDIAFSFLSGGIIHCNLWTPEAMNRLESGTYTVHGNNVNIVLKKDNNIVMNCNLVYNSDKTLTGTYTLQVLPISNPPAGYTEGTVTGNMKLEIQ